MPESFILVLVFPSLVREAAAGGPECGVAEFADETGTEGREAPPTCLVAADCCCCLRQLHGCPRGALLFGMCGAE